MLDGGGAVTLTLTLWAISPRNLRSLASIVPSWSPSPHVTRYLTLIGQKGAFKPSHW